MNRINNGVRCDDFVDKGVDYSNPIVKKYVHKQFVIITGDGEDDFIIDEKPVLIEEYNQDKEIAKQAKGTDLKSLVLQCARTGDFSPLDAHPGVYADITGYPEDTIVAHNNIIKGQEVLESLPDGLKGKSLEELANMSAEEIVDYVKGLVKEHNVQASKTSNNNVVPEVKEVKEEVNNG